jgi:hypothetical protein
VPRSRLACVLTFVAALGAMGVAQETQGGGPPVIVRRLPETGENRAEARWGPALPDPRSAIAERKSQFALRLMVGGETGTVEGGETRSDVVTDSALSLARPLGASSALEWNASALRKLLLAGKEESYASHAGVTAEGASAAIDGSYSHKTARAFDVSAGAMVEHEDIDGRVGARAKIGEAADLPVSIGASHAWVSKREEGVTTADSQTDKIDLAAKGTLGSLAVESSAKLENTDDAFNSEKTLGADGTFAVTVPLFGPLSLRPRITPSYARTDYTSTRYYSLSYALDGELALVLAASPVVELRLTGGRVDSWLDSRTIDGSSSDHLVAWTGGPGAHVEGEHGLHADLGYRIGQRSDSDWLHQVKLDAGGGDETSVWRSLQAQASYDAVATDSGSLVSYRGDWKASVTVLPVEALSIDAAYSGGVHDDEEPVAWDHTASLAFHHQPSPAFGYGLTATLTDHLETALKQLKQVYGARATLKPIVGTREITVGLGEEWSFAASDTEFVPARIGKTSADLAVPVTDLLRLRYRFDWDWVDAVSATGGPGGQFRHAPGLNFGREGFPVSLTADYSISHGYQGIRHDVVAGLDVRIRRDLGAHADFQLGHDEHGSEIPWLLAVSSVYEY